MQRHNWSQYNNQMVFSTLIFCSYLRGIIIKKKKKKKKKKWVTYSTYNKMANF